MCVLTSSQVHPDVKILDEIYACASNQETETSGHSLFNDDDDDDNGDNDGLLTVYP